MIKGHQQRQAGDGMIQTLFYLLPGIAPIVMTLTQINPHQGSKQNISQDMTLTRICHLQGGENHGMTVTRTCHLLEVVKGKINPLLEELVMILICPLREELKMVQISQKELVMIVGLTYLLLEETKGMIVILMCHLPEEGPLIKTSPI